jgi:hypothetical protein
MRAINHALTGAIIGFVVAEPLTALPIAVASHYVMDVIPHHGIDIDDKPKLLRTNFFRNLIYVDVALCAVLVGVLAICHPRYWLLAAACAFAAAAPDFLSVNRYYSAIKHKPWKPGWYTAFASKIQWFEHPIGAFVEVAWFTAALIILIPMLG